MRIHSFPQTLFIAMVALGVLGCNGSDTVTPGDTAGKDTEGAKTQVDVGSSVKLPEDFPQDMPIYPDAKVVVVVKNSPAMLLVTVETSDAIQQVWDHYEKELAANDWENNQTVKTDKGGNISSKKDGRVCTITIGKKNKTGETVINHMLQSVPQP